MRQSGKGCPGAAAACGEPPARPRSAPAAAMAALDRQLPEPLSQRLEVKLEARRLEEPQLRQIEVAVQETGVDPLEALFGTPRLRVYSERPFLILARKPRDPRYDYIELLKRVLREVYRVSWRAPLYSQHIARRLTEYQLAMMRAGMTIYVLDLDELGVEEGSVDKITASSHLARSLEDRVREAYAQGFGFLVVYASQPALKAIERIWEPRIGSRGMLYTRLPPPLETSIVEDDTVFEMVAAMYGLSSDDLGEASSLVDAVMMAEHRYYSYLESMASDPTLALLARPAGDEEEARPEEGFMHYAFKMAVLSYLLEAGFDESGLAVEERVASAVTVDILARRGWYSKLAVEVETLYGSGNPVARLSSVIRDRLAMGYRVWLVVPPLQASIYAPHLRVLAGKYAGVENVEIYTLDMSTGSLVPLKEHLDRLERLAAKLPRAGLADKG